MGEMWLWPFRTLYWIAFESFGKSSRNLWTKFSVGFMISSWGSYSAVRTRRCGIARVDRDGTEDSLENAYEILDKYSMRKMADIFYLRIRVQQVIALKLWLHFHSRCWSDPFLT